MPTNLLGHAPASQWHQVMINGVRFDAVTVVDVLDHVTMSIQTDAPGGLILTVNTDIMRQLPANPDVLEGSALVIADGMPLVWASRILGDPLPARVTGAELVPDLSARAADEGLKVFFFGAAPGVAKRASKQLREQGSRGHPAHCPRLQGAKELPLGQNAVHARRLRAPVSVVVLTEQPG